LIYFKKKIPNKNNL